MITREAFIRKIRDFLRDYKIPRTRFGLDSCGNGKIVSSLEEGKNITLDNMEKIERYMAKIMRESTKAQEPEKDIRTIQ